MFDLKTPIENLYLVGPARAKLLKKLEIHTLGDLLFYFPRKHQDLSKITPIKDLVADEFATVKAKVLEIKSFRTKVRKLALTQALIEDYSGSITCIWFNQPFLTKNIKPHEIFLFAGKINKEKNHLVLSNPIYEQEKAEQIHTARLVPIYWLTNSLTQKQLRTIIKTYLNQVTLPEYLPKNIIAAEKLIGLNFALKSFHFPPDQKSLIAARNRLAFDEIFQTQVKVLQAKKERQANSTYQISDVSFVSEKVQKLPFTLTLSQTQALSEIIEDLQKPYPANRLLEGDVGSGKTIIAALLMALMAKNGFQAALLSPTEVLAMQHYAGLLKLFAEDNLKIALLTSSAIKINGNPVSKQTLLDQIKNGSVDLALGTHALLEKNIAFKNLALVVIDEQHRFGVEQRSTLNKIHKSHLLTMSATPIPRTLALTLYGDLDISVLNELPTGRIKIKTSLISENERNKTYDFIKYEIKSGRQAFVICPLVEESDKLGVKSATAEFEKLSKILPDLNIGLLHGKLKSAEKEKVMSQFKENEIQILVSTSVVEVGVDVPNATVMVIEAAERFGLAQLHQFRGRVGRSTYQSYCFLFSDSVDAINNPRLNALIESNDGFTLAEKDLAIRGAGELYGTTQSGYGFKIATLANLGIVKRSKAYAEELLDADPALAAYPLLKKKIDQKPIVHLE